MKIKQKLKNLIVVLAVMIAGALVVMPTQNASAELQKCGGVDTSIIACDATGGKSSDIKNTGIWGILLLVINIMTAGVGILAVAGIVYGSVLYASAGGSAEQVKKAVTVFTNVVIGIVAYVAMYAFLNFIIPGGLFAS